MSSLRIPFLVTGVYGVLVGVVQLFPGLAEVVFGRAVIDAAVESGWGSALIALGIVLVAATRRQQLLEVLAWPLVAALAVQTAVLVYWWFAGAYSAGTAVPPVVINLALVGWVAYAASRASEPMRSRAT